MLAEKFIAFKKKVKEIAEELVRDNLIDEERFNEIRFLLEKEKIVVGIVGQVKNGKTTLVNALIFGKQVLPAASTPMTASLTRLIFGEHPAVEVEFFTKEEWNEIEKMAKENTDTDECKSAKELVEKAKSIRNELPLLLGQKKEISFNDIYNYVGENGKYVSITKALTIKYPEEILKDIEIVDTPGFNDPIISREMRTKDFLREANVILLLLYAGRPFDINDKNLIFNRITSEGTGKVIILMNKKDVVVEMHGTEEKARNYIESKLEEELNNLEKDNTNNPIIKVLRGAKVIPFSSLMALLGKMSENEIKKDEDFSYHYERFKDEFLLLKNSEDFIKMSGLKELENIINEIIRKQKHEILFKNIETKLTGLIQQKVSDINRKIYQLEMEEKNLSKSKIDIEVEKKNLEFLEKELMDFFYEELNNLSNELKSLHNNSVNEIKNEIYNFYQKIITELPEKSLWEFHSSYSAKVSNYVNEKITNLKKDIENNFKKYKDCCLNKVKSFMKQLYNEANSKAIKYLTWTKKDIFHLMDEFSKQIDIDNTIDLPNIEIETQGSWFLNTARAKNQAISQVKDEIENRINSFKENYEKIYGHYRTLIAKLRTDFKNKVIGPVRNSLNDAERNYDQKEKRLKEIMEQKNELNKQKGLLEERLKFIIDELKSF